MAGFQPITVIRPDSITTTTDVMIGFDPFQNPCLQPLPNFLGQTELLEIDGNNISFTITALGTNPCLNIPLDEPPYEFFNLGTFPEGTYNIQMFWVDTSTAFPIPVGEVSLPVGDVITFIVTAPQVIPLLSFYSLIILGVLLIFLTFINFKKKSKIILSLLVIMLVYSQNISAKTFHILLSSDEGMATPEDIVNQASTSPSPPVWLLSSFNLSSPQSVDYLVKERPFGNLLELINQSPNWSLAKLYNMLIVEYSDSVDENSILINFENDPNVLKASFVDVLEHTTSLNQPTKKKALNKTNRGAGTNFLTDLNIHAAWELSEGMGYIGAVDVGLQSSHLDLRAFDDLGNYQNGNVLDGFYQVDFGSNDLNVDEQEPIDITGIPSFENCDLRDGVDDNLASSIFVGHGTHITGIMVGKNNSVGGICKNCGMSMMKYSTLSTNPIHCVPYNGQYTLLPLFPADASINSMLTLGRIGVGTVNRSGGFQTSNSNFCATDASGSCYAKDFLLEQNVMLVGAAGNHRTKLQFPAGEVGTVAVGGLDEFGNYWNESPNNGNYIDFSNIDNCPRGGTVDYAEECGSNYSHTPINQKLDVMAQARTVFSTFYENGEWADDINCTDFQDGSVDGYGNCTGTSMSAPQVSGILQLMRSTNPLLPNGTYDPTKTDGLINILNATASRSTSGLGVDDHFGYGLPDARLALERILGKSNDVQVKTRLTPMFNIVSTGANNNAYTPFPQVAMAFMFSNGSAYTPDASKPLVNEFTEFWYDTVNLTFPAPRAAFYVFTTNNNPFTGVKNMTPLRRMEKTVDGNRNDTYAISDAEIQSFHNDGYNYAGIEGYILPNCTPTPSCEPFLATKLYRDESDDMNHKLVATAVAPPNSTLLGYVYLNTDTDGDGLIDGQEIILGTSFVSQDTDGDTLLDGVEYPPAGVPYSDPRISDIIFENGFE